MAPAKFQSVSEAPMSIHSLTWTVGYTANPDITPTEFVPATVPGAVQLDWARAHGWPDYKYADNWRQYLWMEDVYWLYRARLELADLLLGTRLVFHSKGIDYKYAVRLDGQTISEHEGMFRPCKVRLPENAKSGDTVEVLVHPAPKSHHRSVDRTQANSCCKPAVSYGWDWHPRLIPLGIWDETNLEVRDADYRAGQKRVKYVLTDDYSMATVKASMPVWPSRRPLSKITEEEGISVCWTLADPVGSTVASETRSVAGVGAFFTAEISRPALWWPNGQGDPALYTSRLELIDSTGALIDTRVERIGFRNIRLVMHEGAWSEPTTFPMSRSNPPITLEVNGRRIFCKGSNWVNPEVFPGTITADTYRPLLELARDAHMNMLRVWGGGIVNKDSFFDLCDEMGLMVWQEFPLACNTYPDDKSYLSVLWHEANAIIARTKHHPSLVIWCGGNELFNSWSGMTEQSLALRTLDSICLSTDPKRPFLMTSPLSGMGHGGYVFRDTDGREVFQVMRDASNTAYTEFGCPGPSSAEYLRTFIPEEDLFPPKPGTAWETHHAFNAWKGDTWLAQGTIEHYFGPSQDLETLVARGQWLQSEGYKCIFEEARRQKPRCAMALNWCFNEPWPTAANNSLINYPAIPKPAYFAVKQSCRPTLASARIPKFSWQGGDVFTAEFWILHDGPEPVASGTLLASLRIGDRDYSLLTWQYGDIAPNTNLAGPVGQITLPNHEPARGLTLILTVLDHPELASEYDLGYRSAKNESVVNETAPMNL